MELVQVDPTSTDRRAIASSNVLHTPCVVAHEIRGCPVRLRSLVKCRKEARRHVVKCAKEARDGCVEDDRSRGSVLVVSWHRNHFGEISMDGGDVSIRHTKVSMGGEGGGTSGIDDVEQVQRIQTRRSNKPSDVVENSKA